MFQWKRTVYTPGKRCGKLLLLTVSIFGCWPWNCFDESDNSRLFIVCLCAQFLLTWSSRWSTFSTNNDFEILDTTVHMSHRAYFVFLGLQRANIFLYFTFFSVGDEFFIFVNNFQQFHSQHFYLHNFHFCSNKMRRELNFSIVLGGIFKIIRRKLVSWCQNLELISTRPQRHLTSRAFKMPVFSKIASLAQFRSLLKSPAASNVLQTGEF